MQRELDPPTITMISKYIWIHPCEVLASAAIPSERLVLRGEACEATEGIGIEAMGAQFHFEKHLFGLRKELSHQGINQNYQ